MQSRGNQSECLVTRLVGELCDLEEAELAESVIILPTERLAVYLLAMLAANRGACIPPKVMTLDSFLSRAFDKDESSSIISNVCLELLLSVFIKEGKFDHIGPGAEKEVKVKGGEETKMGVEEEAVTIAEDEDEISTNEGDSDKEDREEEER